MVTVLHANRALQAATLSAFCLQDPTNVPPGFEATFRFEAIRPGTAGVEERQPFDAAVVARGGKDGPGAAGFTDGTPLAFDDKVLGPIADRIRTALRKLADDAASFTAGLTADASVALLRQLAFQGRDLYDLVGKPLEDARPGAPLDRIQVVVTDTEAFIPVEFIYDLPAPTLDAGLCANARKALRDGRCDPANHPDGDLPDTSSVVCPIGFWALRKVVERQVVGTRDDDALKDRDFAIRAEVSAERPALDALTHAVVAWSDRVDLGVDGQSKLVVKALERMTHKQTVAAKTWKEWVAAIDKDGPPLLVLLSHTVTVQGTSALEIGPDGAGSQCLRVQLVPRFVKRKPEDAPMVLMLGCDTADGRAEPESYIARVRDVGAAVVVGTIAPVLGETAAPVAVALLEELRKTAEDPALAAGGVATFGEAMVRVRRALVAKGHLTALTLTAVGDADWRLSPSPGG